MTWCKSLTCLLVLSLVFLLGVKVGDPDSREQIVTWADGWSAWYAEKEEARAAKREADDLETLPLLAAQCETEAKGVENYGVLVLTDKTGWARSSAVAVYQEKATTHNAKIAKKYEPLWRRYKDKYPNLPNPASMLVPADAPSPKSPVTEQK